ncbi:DNA-directed RNA polymerases IV and V subunit 2-like isoform X1 [Asparagus officinalis]|uniref:DNA-directed RNA polymerases IV and V subunit 2-like isoform X1 n=1 Tax=Asparagus officinalis TaxID=4686 RepID=UPI00098E6389|nr:DNA-directed RNA polymerases IV and V subunit 2-like isoform X1 [Asparagus officinalis]
MDVDSPDCVTQYLDLKEETLERFCKDAARAFFSEFGLINHQINSFNQFITSGLQEIFDSLGEVVVEPGYDPSKGGGGDWQHATITYGKVRLGKPTFWTERSGQETEELKLLPKHARLQNMTYSSKLKVEVRVQVYILEKSDKAKTGKDSHICKRVLSDDKKEITIGSMPVMVKSKLCWLDTLDKSDCLYDSGGYFIVKGAEKMHVCRTCSRFANVIQRVVSNGKIRGPYCGFFKSGENVVRINVPYGAKLLFQELFSMGICLKFETEVC